MTYKIRGSLAAAALAGATWAVAAAAADVTPAVAGTAADAKVPAAATTPAAPSGSSLRAFRDPATGQLRAPTDEEMKVILEEERALRAARGLPEPAGRGAPLAVHRFPNGMRSAVLGPEYRVTLMAERTPDGKVAITHANGQPNAQQRPTK